MRLTIVSFLKNERTPFAEAETEYVKRLSAHAKVELVSVRARGAADKLPGRLLKSTRVIGLSSEGQSRTSKGLARHLQDLATRGQSHLVFAIGGPEGMPAGVTEQLNESWSLSPLTFSHQLARLLLLETLYRSFDILHGGRYHK